MSTKELNPNAKLWVEALRSGSYKQGRYCLRKDDKYCCLGVLAELSGLPYTHNAGGVSAFKAIMKWSGLRSGVGSYMNTSLIQDNDAGYSFDEIANLIEEHADELFVEPA